MEKTLDDQYLELEERIARCNTEKYAIQMEQIKILKQKYAPLIDKKVQYIVKPLFEGSGKTIHYGYLRGFRLVQGKITPMFNRVKKDGTPSKSTCGCAYLMSEIESITLA